jgi:catechol 2,3-dioxygenase-like lactoylglutathione lyase family enzyme
VVENVTGSDGEDWAALVPELLVRDLPRALAFYCEGCGEAVGTDQYDNHTVLECLRAIRMWITELHSPEGEDTP